MDLVAAVSEALASELPGEVAVLPIGVAMERFRPIPRAAARLALGLEREKPYLLFPLTRRARASDSTCARTRRRRVAPDARPDRARPRHARDQRRERGTRPSDEEGYGLAVLEALACDVPVLATPVGIHEEALAGIEGTLCAPFDHALWSAALAPALAEPEPRIAGRARAAEFATDVMARRVLAAWESLVASA